MLPEPPFLSSISPIHAAAPQPPLHPHSPFLLLASIPALPSIIPH